MANSNTEHSKNLRRKTANQTKKEKLESGEYVAVSLTMTPSDEIKPFLDEAMKNNINKSRFIRDILNTHAKNLKKGAE